MRRGALAWTAAIGGTLSLILFLKLRFFACDHLLTEARPGNPSGHTAAAAAVYGGLLAIAICSIWNIQRWALPCTVAIAVFLAVVIGASRLILDLHSMEEVVVGGTIGVVGAVSFVMLAGPPLRGVRMLRVVAIGLTYSIHSLWISHNSRSSHQVGSHQSLAIPRMHLRRSGMEQCINN